MDWDDFMIFEDEEFDEDYRRKQERKRREKEQFHTDSTNEGNNAHYFYNRFKGLEEQTL